MPTAYKYFNSYQVNLLKDLLEQIDPAVLVRGHTYYEANHVLDVQQKGELLEARVLGSASKIYNVHIDLEEIEYFCDCPAALPCKHIACLVIWCLELSEKNSEGMEIEDYAERSASRPYHKTDLDLACIFNEERNRISLFGKDPEGALIDLEGAYLFKHLKQKWQKSLGAFLNLYRRRHASLFLGEGEFPLYDLVKHFHSYAYRKRGDAIPEYYDKDGKSALRFAGFLEFGALVYDTELSGKFGPDTEYQLLLYYFDPLHNRYREVQPTEAPHDPDEFLRIPELDWDLPDALSLPIGVNHALLLPDAPLTEREEKLQNLLSANSSVTEPTLQASTIPAKTSGLKLINKNDFQKKDNKGSFYLLHPQKRVLEKLSLFDCHIPYKGIDPLHHDFKRMQHFMPQDLQEHITQACEAGPALAISMYVDDENQEEPILKAK